MQPRKREVLPPVGRWGEREAGILEVATALFRRVGYENVTMATVAAEAGLSEGTLYNYFHDRHDLVLRVSLAVFEEHAVEAENIVAEAASLRDGLEQLIALQLRILLEAKEIYRIWMREWRGAEDYGNSQARATLRRFSTPTIQLFEKWLPARSGPKGLDLAMVRDLIGGGIEKLMLTAVIHRREHKLNVRLLARDLADAYVRAFAPEAAQGKSRRSVTARASAGDALPAPAPKKAAGKRRLKVSH
jgi:TetR/AcrR family fatty acid metabolism transcriptional regulator